MALLCEPNYGLSGGVLGILACIDAVQHPIANLADEKRAIAGRVHDRTDGDNTAVCSGDNRGYLPSAVGTADSADYLAGRRSAD